ncbi:MAG: hypothetical protein JNG84_07605 [Archangium sp.]|nr:hypothetical protein [Archangium sp.]
MNVLSVYLRLYGTSVVDAVKAVAKSPWTLVLPVGLGVAFFFLAMVLAPLGLVGGVLLGFARAAGLSAYLYFVGELVSKSPTSLSELKKSFGVFFWSVIGVSFVLWVVDIVLGIALENNPQKEQLLGALDLISLIALNAVPETIYVKGTRSGVDTIMVSFRFLQESWIEWFLPNGLLIAAVWFGRGFIPFELVGALPVVIGFAVLFHVVMVFRGFLYLALDGSTHRQRMFRFRNS